MTKKQAHSAPALAAMWTRANTPLDQVPAGRACARVDREAARQRFRERLKAFVTKCDLWPGADPAANAVRLQIDFGRALRNRPLTQEILRRELLERNELTEPIASRASG
jgi:hypothetical protein